MFLAVDIGNTNITLGIFDGDNLVKTLRLISDKNLSTIDYENILKEITQGFCIDECSLASVVDELTLPVKQACENLIGKDVFVLTPQNSTVIIPKTNTTGADRLANAYGALEYKLPVIVVDIGTAITFDIISSDKTFLGGVIMPGIDMELKALKEYTSKLPQISAGESAKAIGDTTENCILSGVMRGLACAVEGLLAQCEEELGERATIIATGGQAEMLSKYMKRRFDNIDNSLTLKGLKTVYSHAKTM